jgi:hypothetical protein
MDYKTFLAETFEIDVGKIFHVFWKLSILYLNNLFEFEIFENFNIMKNIPNYFPHSSCNVPVTFEVSNPYVALLGRYKKQTQKSVGCR